MIYKYTYKVFQDEKPFLFLPVEYEIVAKYKIFFRTEYIQVGPAFV